MQKKKFFVFLTILSVTLLLIAGAFFSALQYIKFMMSSVSSKENAVSVHIDVPSGTSVREIANELEKQGLIKNARFFYYVARYKTFSHKFLGIDSDFSLKSGSYNLNNAMTIPEIMAALQTGHQDVITVVIPEGLTLSKIASIVESREICKSKDFIDCVKNKSIIEDYGFDSPSLDGFLFPDTYFFVRNMESEKVVRMMVDNFFSHIANIDELKSLERKELYDKVILASIVEREYRVADEAPLIASVFINRLEKSMRLQSCATVEYIITEIEGLPHPDVIYYKDLYRESPYNTYREKGIPPTPISNPGLVALKAVANPANTNYYYFRLTDENAGSHTFSETFDEHAQIKAAHTKKAASR